MSGYHPASPHQRKQRTGAGATGASAQQSLLATNPPFCTAPSGESLWHRMLLSVGKEFDNGHSQSVSQALQHGDSWASLAVLHLAQKARGDISVMRKGFLTQPSLKP